MHVYIFLYIYIHIYISMFLFNTRYKNIFNTTQFGYLLTGSSGARNWTSNHSCGALTSIECDQSTFDFAATNATL